jgi:hypothetical protein
VSDAVSLGEMLSQPGDEPEVLTEGDSFVPVHDELLVAVSGRGGEDIS